jgi:hypothetical protein
MATFLNQQEEQKISYYQKMLKTVGSLSRLFSENNEPYIQYRIAENLFCRSFGADNLSRTDCSADAMKDDLGIGIKTFLEKNSATKQKVAEFNSEHASFRSLDAEEKILRVSQLRNERIETTKRIFGLNDIIYHCITRKKNGIIVYETPMDLVDVGGIKNIKQGTNAIAFEDGLNEYSFNITKSTLYKRFLTVNPVLDFEVEILASPFDALEFLFRQAEKELTFAPIRQKEHIFLPLYSMRSGEKSIPEKSGLNQWNADGRARGPNEVYIPIPVWIHKKYPNFFPPRDTSFILLLPDKKEMSAKVCQDNSKALMSNPNSALGEWLLRDILDLKERELLTYEKLRRIGLDSVVIYKAGSGKYDIDFTKIGSYEKFVEENNVSK